MTSYKGSALLLVVTRAQWQHGKSVTAATNVFLQTIVVPHNALLFYSLPHVIKC